MRIGLDFDNTIVSYDGLFHKIAHERAALPPGIPRNKVAVRDWFRSRGQEDVWTEMQGYVYGARMNEAVAYPGAIEFLRGAVRAGHTLGIVSHKTQHPFLGPKYDLHAAAREWVANYLNDAEGRALIPPDQVYFELTKEDKLARVARLRCDVFLDDLPEILLAPGFPRSTRPLLFDPERNHIASFPFPDAVVLSWDDLAARLSG